MSDPLDARVLCRRCKYSMGPCPCCGIKQYCNHPLILDLVKYGRSLRADCGPKGNLFEPRLSWWRRLWGKA